MSIAQDVRREIQATPVGGWVAAKELVSKLGVQHAVEIALSRAEKDGTLVRVHRGLYWKGTKTRFGSTRPDPMAAALAVAKSSGHPRGVGPCGWTASHALGLSTQVPAVTHVAVAGRPPRGVKGVAFHQRAVGGRAGLRPLEVAVLEVLREYPHKVEADWQSVVDRVRSLAHTGDVDVQLVLHAASLERHQAVRERASALARDLQAPTSARPAAASSNKRERSRLKANA